MSAGTLNLALTGVTGPHAGQPVFTAGAPLQDAAAAVVMLHGRGARAGDILRLAGLFERADVAYLAPQARGDAWYPNSFLAPIASNQPELDSALSLVGALIAAVGTSGVPLERLMLLGFSQGACLALEAAARQPSRYGAVVALSGGLITPPGQLTGPSGAFAGTPIQITGSDHDPHVPKQRMEESAAALTRLGAAVTLRIYPGSSHTITAAEVASTKALLTEMAAE